MTWSYPSSLALGFVSGLRTFTAPAVVNLAKGGPSGLALGLLAIGELAADKLPGMPARTSTPALAARLVSGGYVGSSVAGPGGAAIGAALGVVGALGGAFGGMAARGYAARRVGAIHAALVEDAIAVGLAAFVVSRSRRPRA